MSWLMDNGLNGGGGARAKKLQYQQELQAQISANAEAKRLQKAADRSLAFVHPSALGVKPYGRVSDNSSAVLAQELSGGGRNNNSDGGQLSDRHRRGSIGRRGERDSSSDYRSRDRDEDRSRGGREYSSDEGQLFRRASRREQQRDDYDDGDRRESENHRDYDRARRERSREREPPPVATRRNSYAAAPRDYNSRAASQPPPPAAAELSPQSKRYFSNAANFGGDEQQAKVDKKRQYQLELKAQIRAKEDAKRAEKEADRSGRYGMQTSASAVGNRNNAVVPYIPPLQQPQQQQQQQRYDDYVSRGGYSRRRENNNEMDEDDYSRPAVPSRYDDDGRDQQQQQQQQQPRSGFGDMLDALVFSKQNSNARNNDYDNGGEDYRYQQQQQQRQPLYDDPSPQSRQVQWAPEPVASYSQPAYGSGGVSLQSPPRQSDLRPGPPEGAAAIKAQYAADLRAQMEDKARRKAGEVESRRVAERRHETEAAEYNPWGKGGSGAPFKDAEGNVITNRKQAVQQALDGFNSPNRGAQQPPQMQNDHGRGAAAAAAVNVAGGYGSNGAYANSGSGGGGGGGYNSAPMSPVRSNGGGGGGAEQEEKHTRFKFSDMSADAQRAQVAKVNNQSDYQRMLAAQVEEKARKKAEEKARDAAEEHKLEQKYKQDLSRQNEEADREKNAQKMAAQEAQRAQEAKLQINSPKNKRAAALAAAAGAREAFLAPEEAGGRGGVQSHLSPKGLNHHQQQQQRPDSADDDDFVSRSPRLAGGAARRRRRRAAAASSVADDEQGSDNELDAAIAAETRALRSQLDVVGGGAASNNGMRASGSAPALHGRRSERENMGATGLPPALLSRITAGGGYAQPAQQHPYGDEHHPHHPPGRQRSLVRAGANILDDGSRGAGGGGGGSQDAYVIELRKANQLAQAQLALAQAALRQRGVNPATLGALQPTVAGGEQHSAGGLGLGRAHSHSVYSARSAAAAAGADEDDEDSDLLRAVHMDDALDLERKRMHSRGSGGMLPTAAAPITSAPVAVYGRRGVARPNSGGFYHAGGAGHSRPISAASSSSDLNFGATIDESDEALVALQKLQLGLPKGIARDRRGMLALASARPHRIEPRSNAAAGRYPPSSHHGHSQSSHSLPASGPTSPLVHRSNLIPADRSSIDFEASDMMGVLSPPTSFSRVGHRAGNPLEQSMSAHSHLLFHDQDVANLLARPVTRGGGFDARGHAAMGFSSKEKHNSNNNSASDSSHAYSTHQQQQQQQQPAPLSHRTLVRESFEALGVEHSRPSSRSRHHQHQSHHDDAHSQHHHHHTSPPPPVLSHAASSSTTTGGGGSISPAISARGQPSISSMEMDSYVAGQRDQILLQEHIQQHQQQQQQQQQHGQPADVPEESDTARLQPHDHSAHSRHQSAHQTKAGGARYSYDDPHEAASAQHGGAMAASSMAHAAAASNVTATVAVDADGNPLHDAHDEDARLHAELHGGQQQHDNHAVTRGGDYEQSEQFEVQQHTAADQQEEVAYADEAFDEAATHADDAAAADGEWVADDGGDEQHHSHEHEQGADSYRGEHEHEHVNENEHEHEHVPAPEQSVSPVHSGGRMSQMAAEAHEKLLQQQQQQQHHHVADSTDGFAVHHAATNESTHLTAPAVAGVSSTHAGSTSASSKRSQKATRMAANNAALADILNPGSGEVTPRDATWRSTKGGGGGLIKVDTATRTATTLAGTTLPLEGAASAHASAQNTRR